MDPEPSLGIMIVGHGSRREEANADVREVARLIGLHGGYELIEAAFLEIASPNIDEAYSRLVTRGANEIIVHPYFLSPGRHTRGDIPVEVAAAAQKHPDIKYCITEPLAAHRLVVEAAIERIRQAMQAPIDQSVRLQSSSFIAPTESSATDELAINFRARNGWVYLVGAGPGDPGLVTLKARDLLVTCEVVVYDHLVNIDIVRFMARRAECIYVGKVGPFPSRHSKKSKESSDAVNRKVSDAQQRAINNLLIEEARRGRSVVRLKGGDPLVFGRGGEEADALRTAGINFEIVPGITSAIAVPAYAGIPITHRELASSVAIVTGASIDDNKFAQQLSRLTADTLVILMGMGRLCEITQALMHAGRSPQLPAAVIEWGTYRDRQQTIVGTLATICAEATRAGIRPPGVVIVGEVVRLREKLAWFDTIATTIAK